MTTHVLRLSITSYLNLNAKPATQFNYTIHRKLTLSSSSLSHSTANAHFRRRSGAARRIWCARGQLRKTNTEKERKKQEKNKNISDTLGYRLMCHFFVLTTFWRHLIYYWTDTRQHGIYLLNSCTLHAHHFLISLLFRNSVIYPTKKKQKRKLR